LKGLPHNPNGESLNPSWLQSKDCEKKERKKRGGLAVRRANYTHRRKGVFNAESIVESP